MTELSHYEEKALRRMAARPRWIWRYHILPELSAMHTMKTLYSLERLGLVTTDNVEIADGDGKPYRYERGMLWQITDAGRAALEALKITR